MEMLELSLLSLDRSSMQNPRNIFKPLLKHIDLNTKLVCFLKTSLFIYLPILKVSEMDLKLQL